MKRHRNRIENQLAVAIDITTLHQFTAIQCAVTRQIEVIIGSAYQAQTTLDRSFHIQVHIDSAHNHRIVLAQKRAKRRKANDGFYGLDHIEGTIFSTNAVNNTHMVDGQFINPACHSCDGIGRIAASEQKITLMQLLSHERQTKQKRRKEEKNSNTR